ncbi:DUF3592 domain-containing protein [Microbulbifer sp. THAF38]|uniref:DUF3592 domain-containing protein n=1 Tax=Microbulbifer sp. THAF38 TaxID=2587856 RepID=UPI0012694AD3|nr:DUF3592 domain-containing protein [Microbulbifer sp. THAF38]QFT54813.1 hypothetical protein FIU95_09630 [Microbulbifer sp. THAF38]
MDDQKNKKAKITPVSLLFFIAYQAIFCTLLYQWALTPVVDKLRMFNWLPMDAHLIEVDLEIYWDDESTFYQVVASFEFNIDGKTYWGNRVDIHSEPDDSGGKRYHENMHSTLQKFKRQGRTFNGWFNPDNPYDSILDKKLRWSKIIIPGLLCCLFILSGLIVYRAYIFREQEKDPELVKKTPWIAKSKWKPEGVSSETKGVLKGQLWSGFVAALLGAVFAYAGLTILLNGEYAGLFFLSLGIIACLLAIEPIKSWWKFKALGSVSVVINPFPGRVGGKVSGYIQFPQSLLVREHTIRIILKQFTRLTERGGDIRSRREFVNWEAVTNGMHQATNSGIRVYFSFEVPNKLPESNTDIYCGDGEYWYLNVRGGFQGDHFEREYELPVFNVDSSDHNDAGQECEDKSTESQVDKTPGNINFKADFVQGSKESPTDVPVGKPLRNFSEELSSIVHMEMQGGTVVIRQKSFFYKLSMWMIGFAFFMLFLGCVLVISEIKFSFLVFGISIFLFILSVPSVLSVKEVQITQNHLIRKNLWFGMAREYDQINRESIREVVLKKVGYLTSSKKQTRECFNIFARGKCGTDVLVASFIPGRGAAEQLRKRISLLIGRRVRQAQKRSPGRVLRGGGQ